MENARSTQKEKSVNAFHYAVHPIAAQFDKQYTHNYYLYLQRNQQILGRYELCSKTIGKSTRFYFQIPSAIQYFRIISESNLEFRWSLYMQKINDNYRQQEHMQSKKANLKWCWQNYQLHQENVHWMQVIFGVVKLKFYYLFVVGQNHQSILQTIQDYYRKNSIKQTKRNQTNRNEKYLKNQQGKIYSLQKIAQLSHKISETAPFLLQNQSFVKEMKSGDLQNNKSTPAKIVSNINSFQDKMIQNNLVSSFTQGQGNKQETVLKSLEQLKLKLTVSELQISKDIERRIKQSYQEATSKVVQSENMQVQTKHQQKSIFSFHTQERTRQITFSQYLNSRNQMVVSPFYSHFKYWIIIITIFIIFGTLIHLGPKKRIVKIYQNKQSHHQQHFSHKKKKTKMSNNKKKEKGNFEKQSKKSSKKSKRK